MTQSGHSSERLSKCHVSNATAAAPTRQAADVSAARHHPVGPDDRHPIGRDACCAVEPTIHLADVDDAVTITAVAARSLF
jgi:hypothetical protein